MFISNLPPLDKQPNLYELLELKSSYVSDEKIDKAFQSLKGKYNPKENPEADEEHYKKLIAAHRCLMKTRCRD